MKLLEHDIFQQSATWFTGWWIYYVLISIAVMPSVLYQINLGG